MKDQCWTTFTFALVRDQFLTSGAALNMWESAESHQEDGEHWCRQCREVLQSWGIVKTQLDKALSN